MKTTKEIRAEHKAKQEKQSQQLDAELEIREYFAGLEYAPWIIHHCGPKLYGNTMTLCFKPEHGQKWNVQDVGRALTLAGFTLAPATLAQYGSWRSSARMGTPDNQPKEKSNCKLEKTTALAPVWITPQFHTKPTCDFFMTGPHSQKVKVTIELEEGRGGRMTEHIEGPSHKRVKVARMHRLDEWTLGNCGLPQITSCYISRAHGSPEGWLYWKLGDEEPTLETELARIAPKN